MINEIKNVFFKNFFNLSVNQLINILFTLILIPILFKNLGDIQFGIVNLFFSILMMLSVFVGYGYNLNGPKRISTITDKKFKQTLIVEIVSTRFIISLIIFGFCLLTIPFLNFDNNQLYIFIFSLLILFSEAINPFFFFQGTDNLKGVYLSNFFLKLFYLLLIIYFIKKEDDGYLVNFFFSLSSIVVYLFFWIYIFKKENIKWFIINYKNFSKRLSENFYFALSSLASYISISSSLIILSFFVQFNELGKFSLAQKIGFLLRMIPVFITQSILQIATRVKNNSSEFNDLLKRFYFLGLISTFSIGLIITVCSKWIIYLVSGDFINYSEDILAILSFIPFFSMLNFKNMITILVYEMKEILNITTWYSVLFMIIVGSFLSYFYGGYGLSVALLITEIINFFLCKYFIKKNGIK